MASNKNLRSIFSDIAKAIRRKKGSTNKITPINFSDEIDSIELGIFPQGKITLNDTSEYDVTQYATAQIVDENLLASNIKKGVLILGIKGTLISAEELYGYELDTTDVEIEYTIPSVTTINDVEYDLVDNVKGLVKSVNGKTTKSENLFNLTANDFKNGEILDSGYKFTLTLKPNTQYTLSSNESKGTSTAANIWFNGTQSGLHGVFNGTPKKTTTDENGQLYILIKQNQVDYIFANFWIMLNEGSKALPYVPYFEGLKSVEYEGLEVLGENLFDISKYVGTSSLNSTYEISDNSIKLNITGKDAYIGNQTNIEMSFEVEPNTTYYFSYDYTNTNNTLSKIIIGAFDSKKVWINNIFTFSNGLLKGSFTTSDNYHYLSFRFGSNSDENEVSTSIFSNIMLVKGSTAPKKYRPYKEPTTILNTLGAHTLKGTGTARDTLEVVEQDNGLYTLNKVVRIGEVDLGTLTYSYNLGAQTNIFRVGSSAISNIKKGTTNVISVKYHYIKYADNNYSIWVTDYGGIYIQDNDFYDSSKTPEQMVATFKAAMSGVILNYELATPTTTTIATDLTKDEVMTLLEQGGSVEVINSNSEFVKGSTTMEMVYKKTSV